MLRNSHQYLDRITYGLGPADRSFYRDQRNVLGSLKGKGDSSYGQLDVPTQFLAP